MILFIPVFSTFFTHTYFKQTISKFLHYLSIKMARRGGIVEGKVYVGGLPEDATSEEVAIL
jgi:hypothetical protein